MESLNAHPQKIVDARKYLVRAHPFYASLALRLALKSEPGCGSMYTNGRVIGYDPAFVDECKALEVAGVIAHEVMHVALLHHLRRGERDKKGWNVACDYAINAILIDSGLFTLPDGGLYREDLRNLSAEVIYERLKEEQEQKAQQQPEPDDGASNHEPDQGGDEQQGGSPGRGDQPDPQSGGSIWDSLPDKAGEVRDFPGEQVDGATPAEVAQEEREVAVAVFQAHQAEKSCGNAAGALARVLDAHRGAPADWRAILREHLLDTIRSDYSWSMPSRRSHAAGVFLPGAHQEPAGTLAVVVDTSASIRDTELNAFGAELESIAAELELTKITVIYCDSRIAKVDVFEQGEELVLEAKGGGGTRFHPPFNWIAREGEEPHALVYLTDGHATLKRSMLDEGEPDYPVIWATTKKAPKMKGCDFGDVVALDF